MLGLNVTTTLNETQVTSSSSCITSGNLAERIAKTFAYCLIFVASLAGNTLIGLIVYKTRTMRKTINFLIVNMAVSDLVYSVFAFPKILAELNNASWMLTGAFGEAMCKIFYLLPTTSVAVSIQSLVLIAVDRFGAVLFPLRAPLISSKFCKYYIFATWIVAVIYLSPNLAASELVEYSERLLCELRWKELFGETSNYGDYLLSLLLAFYIIPLSVIIALYTSILIKLKSQKNIGEPSTIAEKQRAKRQRNVLKMAIAIVLGFAVCWTPIKAYVFYNYVKDSETVWVDYTSCSIMQTWFIVQFLANANCALNPCICLIFSGNYRQGLRDLFLK